MSGRYSRSKGARGERAWRDMLREHGFAKAYRTAQRSGTGGTADVQAPELPTVHFECKCVERLSIRQALAQATRDAGTGKVPVVAHKTLREGWLVTLSAEHFLEILQRSDLPE
ncbi:MAG: hypothetical protein WAL87_03200 [Chthoniobacterales bacterium]